MRSHHSTGGIFFTLSLQKCFFPLHFFEQGNNILKFFLLLLNLGKTCDFWGKKCVKTHFRSSKINSAIFLCMQLVFPNNRSTNISM